MHLSIGHHLIVRPLARSDAAAFLALINRNRERLANSFPTMIGQVKGKISAARYVRGKVDEMKKRLFYSFIIVEETSGAIAGYVSLKNVDWTIPKAEAAYYIDHQWEGKGVTSKALGAVCHYAFTSLGMNKLFLRVSPDNPASRRVAEKCGFEKEGLMRADFRTSAGVLIDAEYWGLLNGTTK